MKLSTVLAAVVALIIAVGLMMWLQSPGVGDQVISQLTKRPVEKIGDYYAENPFEPISASPPHPKVGLPDGYLHNFGTMALGTTQSHVFVLRNDGEAPLRVAQGRTGCKCTILGLEDEVVPPGGEIEIQLTWKPEEVQKDFSQGAIIWTNDPNYKGITFMIEGLVAPLLMTQPVEEYRLPGILQNEPVPFEVVVYSMIDEEFELADIETSTERMILEDPRPLLISELSALGALSGWYLEGRLEPPAVLGPFFDSLIIHTDIPEAEPRPIRIAGMRRGPFTLLGEGYMARNNQVDLGRFDASQGRTSRMSLIGPHQGEPIEVLESTVSPQLLEFSLSRNEEFVGEGNDQYFLEFTVPPGQPPIRFVSASPVKVTVRTDHPDAQLMEFNVIYSAE